MNEASHHLPSTCSQSPSFKAYQRALVLIAFIVVLLTAFRAGWTRSETDFPNYYTAAAMVRRGEPLRLYYDWTWFARKMNELGFKDQIGSYAAQTPLTMLPLVPLSSFPPQTAKRLWLTLNLALLMAVIVLLARSTSVSAELVSLLAVCGFFSLRTNFLYGQYYIVLLFLLTLAYFFLVHSRPVSAGLVAALAFALKLYAAPLLLYFLVTRNRKAAGSMVAGTLCLWALAISIFGWHDVTFYAFHVFGRSLEGGPINPYDPANQTVSTLFHDLFRWEPELNPRPPFEALGLCLFAESFVRLAILGLLSLAVWRRSDCEPGRGYACFIVGSLLLSTSVASYTYILLLLPVVLLWQCLNSRERLVLIGLYVLLMAPLPVVWLFPKVWLLVILLGSGLFAYRQSLQVRALATLFLLAAVFSLIDARRHLSAYVREPGRQFERIATQSNVLFSGFPVVLPSGLVFQSLVNGRYVISWFHDRRVVNFAFDGQSVSPRASKLQGSVDFDLLTHGKSIPMRIDPSEGTAYPTGQDGAGTNTTELSPDRKWIAYSVARPGTWEQIYIRSTQDGAERQLTFGDCASSSPAWEADSKAIVFASDCDRPFGLPALSRAVIAPEVTYH